MANGINVDEESFAKMEHDDQIKSIFHAIVTTNENFCKQPEICEINEKRKIPLNKTIFSSGVVLKSVPVIITSSLILPVVILKFVIVATIGCKTVNGKPTDACPSDVTIISPVVAPTGIVTTISLILAETIVASIPLKVTVLSATEEKYFP